MSGTVKKPLELPNLKEDVDDFILGILGGDPPSSFNNSFASLDYEKNEVIHNTSFDKESSSNKISSNEESSTQVDTDIVNNVSIDQNNSNLNLSVLSPTSDIKNLYKTPTQSNILDSTLSNPFTPPTQAFISSPSNNYQNSLFDKISPIPNVNNNINVQTTHISPSNANISINRSHHSSLRSPLDSNSKSQLNNTSTTNGNTSSVNSSKSDSVTKNLLQDFSLELNSSQNTSYDSIKSNEYIYPTQSNIIDIDDFELSQPLQQQSPSQVKISPKQLPTQSQIPIPTQTTQNSKKTKRINYDLVTGKPTRPLKMIKGYMTPIKNNIINNNSNISTPLSTTKTFVNNNNNNDHSIPSFQTLLKNHLASINDTNDNNNNNNDNDNDNEILTLNTQNNNNNYNLISPPTISSKYDIDSCFDLEGGSDDEIDNKSEQDLCPICQESFIQPHESPCKHRCCLECWTKWLSLKLECPVCRERTRIKQLKKV